MQVNTSKYNSISPDGVMIGTVRISSNAELISILQTMVPVMTATIRGENNAMGHMARIIVVAEAGLNVRKTVFQPPIDSATLLERANSIWSAIVQIVSGRSVEDEIAIVGVNRAIAKVTTMCEKTSAEIEDKAAVNKNLSDLLQTVVQCRLELKQATPASSGTMTIAEEAESYLKFLEETRDRMISRKSSGVAIPEKPTIENIAVSVINSSTQESPMPMPTPITKTPSTTTAQPKLHTVNELLGFRKALRVAVVAQHQDRGALITEIVRIGAAMSITFSGSLKDHVVVINHMIDEQLGNATEALLDQRAIFDAAVDAAVIHEDGVHTTPEPLQVVKAKLDFPSMSATSQLTEAEVSAIEAAQASIGSAAVKPETVVEEVVVIVVATTPAPETVNAEAKPDTAAQPAAASAEAPAAAKSEVKEPLLSEKQKRYLTYFLSSFAVTSVIGAGAYMFLKRNPVATAE